MIALYLAMFYGRGIYFGAKITTSYCYSNPPDPSTGRKYVLVCRIATGLICVGTNSMNVLPLVEGKNYRYHSACDNLNKIEEHVIFHDNGAIPVYLLEIF